MKTNVRVLVANHPRSIFIIRANGSVTSGSSGLWSGGVHSSSLGPGDTIVVPEKAVLGSNTSKNVVSMAQIAQAAAGPPRLPFPEESGELKSIVLKLGICRAGRAGVAGPETLLLKITPSRKFCRNQHRFSALA